MALAVRIIGLLGYELMDLGLDVSLVEELPCVANDASGFSWSLVGSRT